MNGYADYTIRAGNSATRAEAATMIFKLLEALKVLNDLGGVLYSMFFMIASPMAAKCQQLLPLSQT
ncbi:hypothetical protein ACFQZT_04385 [Paenibacillus sp. GCM10027628]|uniref:hypothetical protein n=1 Tax=Paenibacillus sp. GCM10027628 TaxID=3273413 RepID=UPI00362C6395